MRSVKSETVGVRDVVAIAVDYDRLTPAEMAALLLAIKAVGPSRMGAYSAQHGLLLEMPSTNEAACATIQSECREKIQAAIERAASNERRRLACLLDDARRIVGLYAAERSKSDALAGPATLLRKEIDAALADRNAQSALPVPMGWHQKREELEGLLTLSAELIRDHLQPGRPGVPGSRVCEVLTAIADTLERPELACHLSESLSIACEGRDS